VALDLTLPGKVYQKFEFSISRYLRSLFLLFGCHLKMLLFWHRENSKTSRPCPSLTISARNISTDEHFHEWWRSDPGHADNQPSLNGLVAI
jgi:hypothetical protein